MTNEEKSYKKSEPKLSEEIKRYGKVYEVGAIKNVQFPVYIAKIPYNGFSIILLHSIVPKKSEKFFYSKSKYGWWQFCAMKDEIDSWDKKLLYDNVSVQYGQYREHDHSFCNDNMQGGKLFYNMSPNEMIDDIKQQIGLYLRDKEIEIARSKMTKEDYELIEQRAKVFLDNVIKENDGVVFEVNENDAKNLKIKKELMMARDFGLNRRGGWIVKGKDHSYFVDTNGRAHFFNPSGKLHMTPICIQSRWNNKYIHIYDHIASRILALINDSKVKKNIHTLGQ